jgi:hydroxyethylthiazole kinase
MHRPAQTHADMATTAAAVLDRLRARGARVHCVTNNVAQNFTANVLLAAGCVPSMTLSAEEIASFVAGADSLLVNLGTFDAERRAATEIAVKAAREKALPWVLDPVFIDRNVARAAFARTLLQSAPAAVRLNQAEYAALAGGETSPAAFASASRTVLAVSGEIDRIVDGARAMSIANGHPLMARVTAMGCAGSALVAACLAVEPDAFLATAAALLILGVAGEQAAEKAQGPGSFAVALLDALYNLNGATVAKRAKVS